MKVDVDQVWDMEVKEFFLRLRHMESILAEERYILQRQLDNHIKAKNKKTINNFKDIYDEFAKTMGSVSEIKYKKNDYTDEEIKAMHEENLKKLGLG